MERTLEKEQNDVAPNVIKILRSATRSCGAVILVQLHQRGIWRAALKPATEHELRTIEATSQATTTIGQVVRNEETETGG
jgi:hypothetical protein